MLKATYRALALVVLATVAHSTFAEGSVARGENLTATCVACHAGDGNSMVGTFPNIAGQHESYLLKQMREMKAGERDVGLMVGILDTLSDQDLQDLAAYYATKDPGVGAADPELAEAGEAIYRAGIPRKGIAACSACHLPAGNGNGPAVFPALSGQWTEYTEAQLKHFRSGARANDGDSQMMRLVARDMSDDEIAAVASYIRGLR